MIGVLSLGYVDPNIVLRIQENLSMTFPKTKCSLVNGGFMIPKEAFDKERHQHRSDIILNEICSFHTKERRFERILGVVDVDIFIPSLSFVFGEAQYPGNVALISLFRLRPEFYGRKPNSELLVERSTKEAVHELGHTYGLRHCSNPFCVMYFSNSIFETDRKQSLFCRKCDLKIDG